MHLRAAAAALTASLYLFFVSAPLTAAEGSRVILPVVGSTSGAYGSTFRTELQLTNPSSSTIRGRLVLRQPGSEGSSRSLDFELPARATETLRDVMAEMGASGMGSLDVVSVEGAVPVVTARAYQASGSGTRGLIVPALRPSDALTAGFAGALVLPELASESRANVGVRALEGGARIRFIPRTADGTSGTPIERTYGSNGFEQQSAAALLGGSASASGSVTVVILEGAAFVYATMTDNRTNDPSIQVAEAARYRPAARDAAVSTQGRAVSVELSATHEGADRLLFSIASSPGQGTVGDVTSTGTRNARVTYTPSPAFSGTDTFTFRVDDENGGFDFGTVTITDSPGPHAPVAADALVATDEDRPVEITLRAHDADGDALRFSITRRPARGNTSVPVAAGDGAATLLYSPAPDEHGSDSFEFTVHDATGRSDSAVVTIEIAAANDTPVAGADSAELLEDRTLTVAAPGVLANDADVETRALAARLVTAPRHGTLTLGADGSYRYTPHADAFGTDSFTYTADDGQAVSAPATVALTITPVNDPPSFSAPGAVRGAEDGGPQTFRQWVHAMAAGPENEAGQSVRFVVTANTSPALFTDAPAVTPDGTLTWTAAPDANGSATITIELRDDGGTSHGGTDVSVAHAVTIEVSPVNDAPAAAADAYEISEDTPLVIDAPGVLANDNDIDSARITAAVATAPAHGTLTLAPAGGFTYTPAADFHGSDSFAYRADDGSSASPLATVSLTVAPVNDAPAATADRFEGEEDGTIAGNVLANDTDVEGTPLTATLVTPPAHGTVELRSDGTFAYTPAANFNGTDSFRYRAADGALQSEAATATLVVAPRNDAPTASADSYVTNEDTALRAGAPGVLANDADLEGSALTAQLVRAPSRGLVTLEADGSFTYTPAANAHGTDTFTYRVSDGNLTSGEATVTIAVAALNDVPVAVDDAYRVDEDSPLEITAGAVLTNDVDPDGDRLVAAVAVPVSQGELTFRSDGTFRYVPPPDYHGSATFAYEIWDGTVRSDPATVTITIAAANDAPVAAHDVYETSEDMPLDVAAAAGVLANDRDAEAATLTAELVSPASNGTVTLRADGSFTYVPSANVNGSDAFTYRVSDGQASSAEATATITIRAVNDAPSAQPDAFTTREDTAIDVMVGVLANDSDIDGPALSAVIHSGPAHGTLTLRGDGTFRYVPAENHHGTDAFSYKASDGTLESSVVTVSLTIEAVDDVPVARDDAYGADEDNPVTVAAPGVLANDSDAESATLTAVLGSHPSHGLVTMADDGSFTYAPRADFSGTDTFTYHVLAGEQMSPGATVTITVRAINDRPLATKDAYSTNEDTSIDLTAGGVLGNDSDVEGTPLTAVLVALPAHGTLTLRSDGTFRYVPEPNFSGIDSFSYHASDGELESQVVPVDLTVHAVNDAPAGVTDSYTVDEDGTLTVPAASGVLANDTDTEGSALTATLVSAPSHGSLVLHANGSFTYTPAADFAGADAFTYRASDGSLESGTTTVSMTVRAVNDRPVATGDAYSTNEDSAIDLTAGGVLSNDSDVEGTALTPVLVTGPARGTLTLRGDGTFRYVPEPNFSGTESFSYKASDGELESAAVTVDLTVHGINDAPAGVTDSYAVDEDGTLTVPAASGVLANDTDAEGSALTATLVSSPSHGSLVLHANGSFTYTPAADFAGADAFTYRASDGSLESGTTTVSITVRAVNDAPVATADTYATDEDTAIDLSAGGVLSNDRDDGPMTAVLVSGASHGTLTLRSDGTFRYVPAANYSGSDSFTYAASDGALQSAPATVTLAVNAVDDPPVAAGDAYTTTEDVVLNVAAPGVLANDSDPDSPATASLLTLPQQGTLTLRSDGSFSYAPAANFNGTDSFSYRAASGGRSSAAATVSLTITPVDDAPTVQGELYDRCAYANRLLTLPKELGLLANDSDPDGPLTATLVRSDFADVTVNPDGSFTYFTSRFSAGDITTIDYTVSDGTTTRSSTARLVLGGTNTKPVAVNDRFRLRRGTSITASAAANDYDVDFCRHIIIARLVTGPSHGTLTLSWNGAFTYTHNGDNATSDQFSYVVSDGVDDSNVATVTFALQDGNPPVAGADQYRVLRGSPLVIRAPGVLGNDTDADRDPLQASLVTGPAYGALTLNADGSFTYAHHGGADAADSFTYEVSDGFNTAIGTVTLTIADTNAAPQVVGDTFFGNEDTGLSGNVLANDSDADGDKLFAILTSSPYGSLTLDSSGSFYYAPPANWHGTTSFTYQASDGITDSAPVTVTLHIAAVNDAPVAEYEPYYCAPANTTTYVPAGLLLANDTDIDGDALSVRFLSQLNTSFASWTYHDDGSLTVVCSGSSECRGKFEYVVSDGQATSGSAWVVFGDVTSGGNRTAPGASEDRFSVKRGSTLQRWILGNDYWVERCTPMYAELVSPPAHGTATISADGWLTYNVTDPTATSDVLQYRLVNAFGSSTAYIRFTIGD